MSLKGSSCLYDGYIFLEVRPDHEICVNESTCTLLLFWLGHFSIFFLVGGGGASLITGILYLSVLTEPTSGHFTNW